MQIVFARFQFDVPRLAGEPRAERMDVLAARFQQARHRILRQPVDLHIRMQLAQLPRDSDVAAPVPEPDRRREIEHSLRFAGSQLARLLRGADAELAIEEIDDQGVALGRKAAQRIVTAARNGHELGTGDISDELARAHRAGCWSSSPWIISIGQRILRYIASLTSKCWQDRSCFHGLGQHRAGGVARPVDAILDLLGRVRFGIDIANEMLGEIGIVRQPVLAVVFVPALEPLLLRVEMLWSRIGIAGGPMLATVPTRIAAFTRSG